MSWNWSRWTALGDRLVDRWIPASLRANAETHRRARTQIAMSLMPVPHCLAFALLYALVLPTPAIPWIVLPFLVTVPFCLSVAPVLRLTGSPRTALRTIFSGTLAGLIALTIATGGSQSHALSWVAILPSLAHLLVGRREGVVWWCIDLLVYAAFLVANTAGVVVAPDLVASPTVAACESLSILLVVGACFLLFDRAQREAISTLRVAHGNLTLARAEADRASDSKSQFLSRMSHRIRTPLMAILGFGELLVNGEKVPEEDEEALRTMRRNAEHLLRIVDDMLDLSRIESDALEIALRPVDPLVLAGEVAELLKGRAESKGIELRLETEGALPAAIETDPTRLRQTLLNLVGNAIKFTERGQVSLRIEVRDELPGRIRFCVTDTGIGMASEEVALLFQPFVQANRSTSRLYGGSGLGLVISRRLIEAMGGSIRVESTPGSGTHFEIELPTGRTDAAPVGAMRLAAPERALERHVLVVDDTADNRTLLQRMLHLSGARVTLAQSGEHALACVASAAEAGFDLILMDLHMPGLDGYQTLGKLRETGYRGRIVALTADAMLQTRDRCLAAGFDGYATKPIDRRRLVELVRGEECTTSSPKPRPAAPKRVTTGAGGLAERCSRAWLRLVLRFVPEHLRDDPDAIGRAEMLVGAALTPIPVTPILAWLAAAMLPVSVALPIVGLLLLIAALAVSVPFLMRTSRSAVPVIHAILGFCVASLAWTVAMTGGVQSYVFSLAVVVPVSALAVLGQGAGAAWVVVIAGFHLGFAALGHEAQNFADTSRLAFAHFMANGVLVTWLFSLSLAYETAIRRALARLEHSVHGLAEARDRAERASESKGRFLATISHEMRTPMTALLGFADLILESWDDRPDVAASRPTLVAVRRNGTLLLDLINDLLDLSRLEAGRVQLDRLPFSPRILLDEVAGVTRSGPHAREVQVHVWLDPSLPAWLYDDALRIRQILVHLVSNALRWSGCANLWIRLAAAGPEEKRAGLVWSVEDDGCGLPDGDVERLSGAEPVIAPDRNTGSAGLGLALCRHLCAALGGRLELETRAAGGLCAKVVLPRHALPADAGTAGVMRHGETSPSREAARSRLHARVLLVEDSPDNQRLIATILRGAGAEVDVASDGQQAIARVCAAEQSGASYDIVLMDMQMPVMDGATATRALRESGFACPILALTAQTRAEARESCMAAGCDDLIPKPIDRRELIAILARLTADPTLRAETCSGPV